MVVLHVKEDKWLTKYSFSSLALIYNIVKPVIHFKETGSAGFGRVNEPINCQPVIHSWLCGKLIPVFWAYSVLC